MLEINGHTDAYVSQPALYRHHTFTDIREKYTCRSVRGIESTCEDSHHYTITTTTTTVIDVSITTNILYSNLWCEKGWMRLKNEMVINNVEYEKKCKVCT